MIWMTSVAYDNFVAFFQLLFELICLPILTIIYLCGVLVVVAFALAMPIWIPIVFIDVKSGWYFRRIRKHQAEADRQYLEYVNLKNKGEIK